MTMQPDNRELAVLAELLSSPQQESLDILSDTAAVFPWLQDSVEELKTTPLDQWQAEHTRLFVNGYPKTPCPPFQSAFKHGSLGGEEDEALNRLYNDAGLSPTPDLPPDYLGTMLQFGAWCLRMEKDELWNRLREHHIDDWLGGFAETLQQEAELKLYQVLGQRLSSIAA